MIAIHHALSIPLYILDNMANVSMDIKTLQYVMEHFNNFNIGVTLSAYIYARYDCAGEQIAKILEFKESDVQGKQRKSG